jgi:hypothetical protein
MESKGSEQEKRKEEPSEDVTATRLELSELRDSERLFPLERAVAYRNRSAGIFYAPQKG